MVNPGGTGTPMLVISARFAPLPPSRFFISLFPSALPPPKKKMRFLAAPGRAAGALALTPLPTRALAPLVGLSLLFTLALTLAAARTVLLMVFLREGIVGGCLSGSRHDGKPGARGAADR